MRMGAVSAPVCINAGRYLAWMDGFRAIGGWASQRTPRETYITPRAREETSAEWSAMPREALAANVQVVARGANSSVVVLLSSVAPEVVGGSSQEGVRIPGTSHYAAHAARVFAVGNKVAPLPVRPEGGGQEM